MKTEISDYIHVSRKLDELGCNYSEGVAILPVNFETATSKEGFSHLAEASTLKTLLNSSNIPYSEIRKKDEKTSYIHNNAFELIVPTLLFSASLLSHNPEAISVSLSVIANYLTDFLKGSGRGKNVKLDIVVEKTKSKTYKKISCEGNIDDITKLPDIVKEVANE